MPVKRKYTGMKYGKSKAFCRKRFFSRMWRKRVTPRKMIPSINRTPISYTREIPLNNIVIPLGDNKVFFAAAYTLSNLTNYAEFTALFDQYRIRTIIVKFRLV